MLQALGVLALTVTVHELGHFLAARTQNIHVTKFSVGFGPILWKWQVGRGGVGGRRCLVPVLGLLQCSFMVEQP